MKDQPADAPATRVRGLLILLAVTVLLPIVLAGVGLWERERVRVSLADAIAQREHMAGVLQQMKARQKPGGGYDFTLRFRRGDQTFVGPLAVSEAQKALDLLDEDVELHQVRTYLPPVTIVSAGALLVLSLLAMVTAFVLGHTGRVSRDMLVSGFNFSRRMLRPVLVLQVVLASGATVAIIAFEALGFLRWGFSSANGAKLFGAGVVIIALAVWTAFKAVIQLRRAVQLFDPDPLPVIGHAVSRADAPGLWGLLDELAGRLGALKPDTVVVGLGGGFFVSSGQKVLRPDGGQISGNTLYLPLPYLALLREDEVATIIGHELAHFSGGDTQYSLRFVPLYAGVARSLEAVATAGMGRDGVMSPLVYPAFQLGLFVLNQFDGAVLHWSRKREFAADAAGAGVTSREAGGRALLRTLAVEQRISEVLRAAAENPAGAPADLVAAAVAHVAARGADDPTPHLGQRQPHPTDTHPPTLQRLAALGQQVTPAAIADAIAPPAPDAPARLATYFAAPEALASAATARFLATVRQDVQAHREALQAAADEVSGEALPLYENSRAGAIFVFVFGGLFLAAGVALAIIGQMPGTSPSDTLLIAGLGGGLGLIFMVAGIPLLTRGKTPFLTLERDAMVHPGLDRPIPWADMSGLDFMNDKGNILTYVRIAPEAPFPTKLRGAKRIKLDAKKRLITIKAIPPRKLKIKGYVDVVATYARAGHARRALAEDRRSPHDMNHDPGSAGQDRPTTLFAATGD